MPLYISGWKPSDWTVDANSLYTTSSQSVSRWPTWYSACIFTLVQNCDEGRKVRSIHLYLINRSYFSPDHFKWCFCAFPFNRKISRRFGIIECDPLVIKGLERTVRKILSNFYSLIKFTSRYHFHKIMKTFMLAFVDFCSRFRQLVDIF